MRWRIVQSGRSGLEVWSGYTDLVWPVRFTFVTESNI
jgi:hypothetical protein